jgi:endonuclease/exonuclease/phosphatase family metal-dependent hydrolase
MIKCLNWNLEWRTPRSAGGNWIAQKIRELDPDVSCLTEVTEALIPEGEALRSDLDYGYENKGDRRKVVLWSREPWTEVDLLGNSQLPTGRFVSGVTMGIRFIGVCIPWQSAHMSTGRKDRKSWEDHLIYCQGLTRIIEKYRKADFSICVLGDYNQRIPRVRQPVEVAEALAACFPTAFNVCTSGINDDEGKPLIDHCAVSPGLSVQVTEIIPKQTPDGNQVSDHAGVLQEVS